MKLAAQPEAVLSNEVAFRVFEAILVPATCQIKDSRELLLKGDLFSTL